MNPTPAIAASDRPRTRFVIAVIALAGLFYAATLQPGFPWGDDFAEYLSHAKNIATGRPYADTGYIYNPAQPEVGPRSYPPLFPLLLAPLMAAGQPNSKAIKAEVAVFFLAALWGIYAWLRLRIPAAYAAAIVALIGFNPFLWNLKDNPVSDVPFLVLLFFTFERVWKAEQQGWKALHQSLLAGVLLYLCFACRAAGIILFPSLLISEILHERRLPRRGVWVSLMIGLAGVLVQVLVLRGEASYLEQFHFERIFNGVMAHHLKEYAWTLRSQFFALPGIPGTIFTSLLLGLGIAGYILAVRRGVTLAEVFVPAYLITIFVVWTSDWDLRFLLPVLPLWLFYVAVAILRMRDFGNSVLPAAAGIALATIIAFGYGNYFARASFGPDPSGTNDQGFLSACRFVREKTAPDAIILFSKPRLLALLTDRKSAVYPLGTADQIVAYGKRISATYVISGEPFENDRERLIPLLAARPDVFEPVFQSGGFGVYRIRPEPQSQVITPAAIDQHRERPVFAPSKVAKLAF